MHMVIRAIVHAKTAKSALEKAKAVFDGLVETGEFDYYTTFDDDSAAISGKARWGPLPAVARADSPEGKVLIDEGMKYTWEEFKHHMESIREVLGIFTDEEIFEGRPDETKAIAIGLKSDSELLYHLNFCRFFFYCCSGYHLPDVWLYDEDGNPISNREELKSALKPRKGLKAWVVPADVHW